MPDNPDTSTRDFQHQLARNEELAKYLRTQGLQPTRELVVPGYEIGEYLLLPITAALVLEVECRRDSENGGEIWRVAIVQKSGDEVSGRIYLEYRFDHRHGIHRIGQQLVSLFDSLAPAR